ncbi:MAG: Peroxisomal membrane protein pex16 [Tremellales sp. Tagirdzhanova-0007]|nr:MAG: Peroxisomal membrane protein pex16 [Tremellales sp. Tagirdzhanova-0007]
MTSLVHAYETLLLSNLSAVRTLESALRNITWLLPGRFEDAELASEGLYALLNVVSGYHDTLLSKRVGPNLSLPPHPFANERPSATDSTGSTVPRIVPLLPPPSEHARYTRYWTNRSNVYRRASRALVTIGYVELLVEMVARKRGDRSRWRIVLLIESIKTMLRLVLLRITRRPVLYPPTPQREYDITALPSELLNGTGRTSSKSSHPIVNTLQPRASLKSHLYPMARALPDSHLPHPCTLVPELDSTSAWTSEILSSTATLLHVILLIRATQHCGPKYRPTSLPTLSRALPPFLAPLALHLLARQLRPPPKSSLLLASHHSHLDRRTAAHFFLTGPMWIGWTRPKVMRVLKGLERIPLVGLVGELVEGYLFLVDDYFYCESDLPAALTVRYLVLISVGMFGGSGEMRCAQPVSLPDQIIHPDPVKRGG